MARQVINTGASDNDISAETVRSAFTKVNTMTADLYSSRSMVWHNVTDPAYGAVGDYNHTADTGTDDTAAIQAAIDAAEASDGYSAVVFPGGPNRAYKISDTLVVQGSIQLMGLGWQPGVWWRGAAGGTMLQIGAGGGHTAGSIENLSFTGYKNDTNIASGWAGVGIEYLTTVDAGCRLINVAVANINGHAIKFKGSTNSFIYGGRFDRCTGYCIYHDLSDFNCVQQMHDLTWDSWDDSMGSPYSKGFMFLDGESGNSTFSFIHITGFHPEINGTLSDTYAAGTNPSDKRGLIRLGINPSVANIQHTLEVNSVILSLTTGSPSHSFFQCTSASGTLAQHAARIALRLTSGRGVARQATDPDITTNVTKLLANVPPEFEYQFGTRINVAEFARYGTGGAYAEVSGRDVGVPHSVAQISRTYSQLSSDPVAGEGPVWITDSSTATWGAAVVGGGANPVWVGYNGSDWTVVGK